MSGESGITRVASDRTRCTGSGARSHDPVELVLRAAEVVRCPVCGRRFRRAAPGDRTDPAVWPKDD